MKRKKKAKVKINFKRFIISLSLLTIILLLTINISKKILAKSHNDKNIESSKNLETYENANKDKKTDNPVENMKDSDIEDDVPLEKENPKKSGQSRRKYTTD